MINMSSLYNHSDYAPTLSTFTSSSKTDGVWTIFKSVHMKITKCKCPICECPLDGSVKRDTENGNVLLLTPTIDHYRPKKDTLYPNLKYDDKNYILMCSDCNSEYKKAEFPLHSSTPNRNTTATSTSDITDEKPLIVNPIYDNPFDLFTIIFRFSPKGTYVLELKPKSSERYLKEKAEKTIKLFSLGNWENAENNHHSDKVQNCRLSLITRHFNNFHSIAKILKGRTLENLERHEQIKAFKEIKKRKLKDYGFYESIVKGNYKDLV